MRRLLPILFLLAAASCSGGEGSPAGSEDELSRPGFGLRAASAIEEQTDLEAEFLFRAVVRVQEAQGPDWIRLDLEEEYRRYTREPGSLDEILAEVAGDTAERIEAGLDGEAFADVRKDVLPLLKPPFALREFGDPPRRRVAGNLSVVYGVQTDDQFRLVGADDLERWGRTVGELDALALDNLARKTREEEALLCEEQLCGWASGDGYDATRMIVPALRRDIVEEIGPAIYAVPQENVFVALPLRLADRIKARVQQDFARAENPVSPEIFVEREGRLVPLEA